MEPIILFDVTNQHIRRTDDFRVVAKSKNYLRCRFLFRTEDWYGQTKTAIFKSSAGCYAVLLENDCCLFPWECLWVSGSVSVSVYAGNLITADAADVRVYESGYQESAVTPSAPTPSIYAQLLALLERKADGLRYTNSILSLLAGETVLSDVQISGGGGGSSPTQEEWLELAFDCGLIQPYQIGSQVIADENGRIIVG